MKSLKPILLLAAACASMGWSAAQAQNYPNRPITFVVPSSAGGTMDALARAVADEMGKSMGQPIIVDNKLGASGQLAAQTVARSNPDGYTLLVTHSAPMLTAPFVFTKLPYDPFKDFAFVADMGAPPYALAVSKNVPANTMAEFIDWARKNKGKVSYGNFGIGGFGHLMASYLNLSNKLDMVSVAYKGEVPMVQDLVGGQISWGIASAAALLPQIESGNLRALAVFGDKRLARLPNVPTLSEAGLKDPEYKPFGWIGLLAPAATPAPLLERLEKEVQAAMKTTAVKARLQAYVIVHTETTSAQFRKSFEESAPIIERLVKLSGMTPQ